MMANTRTATQFPLEHSPHIVNAANRLASKGWLDRWVRLDPYNPDAYPILGFSVHSEMDCIWYQGAVNVSTFESVCECTGSRLHDGGKGACKHSRLALLAAGRLNRPSGAVATRRSA